MTGTAQQPVAKGQEAVPRVPPPRRRRPLVRALQVFAIGLVCLLLALLAWRLLTDAQSRSLVSDIDDGKKPPAPTFALPVIWEKTATWPAALRPATQDGHISLGELRGYPVVLNVWASWCIPCREEAPILDASATRHAGRVAFLGIDVQDFTSDARRFLARYNVNYVSVRDGGSDTYENYGLTGVPETYYLDTRGRIVAHTLGALSQQELEAGITKALESSSP